MAGILSRDGIPKKCPNAKCDSKKLQVMVIDYNMMWHDGKVVCSTCNTYIRDYDAG